MGCYWICTENSFTCRGVWSDLCKYQFIMVIWLMLIIIATYYNWICRHQGFGSFGNDGAAFGFSSPDQHLTSRLSTPATSNPFPAVGGNPFGWFCLLGLFSQVWSCSTLYKYGWSVCIVCLHGLFSQAPSILRNLRSVICGVGKDECEKSAYQKEGSYRIEIISLFEGVNRALRGD